MSGQKVDPTALAQRDDRSATQSENPGDAVTAREKQIDYSHPAADADPRVEARRLSIRPPGGRRSVPHVGAVCPRYVMPLGYEYYDVRIRCLTQSPIATLTRPDFRSRSPGRPSVSGLTRSGEYS
jgi:hypothetical protein